MEELEKKVADESHNIVRSPLNQVTVASTSATNSWSVIQHKEQDLCMANGTGDTHEVEALSNDTKGHGPPVLTGEDVNMVRQTHVNSQLHEPFADKDINMGEEMDTIRVSRFADKDINMGGETNVNSEKQRKKPLDDDEEDFGLDFYEPGNEGEDDDSDPEPEIVSIVHILENWVIWLTVR